MSAPDLWAELDRKAIEGAGYEITERKERGLTVWRATRKVDGEVVAAWSTSTLRELAREVLKYAAAVRVNAAGRSRG